MIAVIPWYPTDNTQFVDVIQQYNPEARREIAESGAKMDENPAADLGRILQARGLTIGTAESCTGGLIASTLTDVPGSSAWVLGGIVAYDNAIKERVLGVPHGLLLAHGAVSAPVANAMARGALALLGCDLAVSVTGIAGPGGGTADKPVGLTYIAAAWGDEARVQEHRWAGDRYANKVASVQAALAMIRNWVEEGR
jgi:PncC family amidohydrolase